MFVNKDWLPRGAHVIITQTDLERTLKSCQSKFCLTVPSFSFHGYGNTQIDILQQENFAGNFSLTANSNKRASSIPCHFRFNTKCTNKLLPTGHLWQRAILCQLLLKTIHITAPKLSFKITIFCNRVTGCQLWKCQWETGSVVIVNFQDHFNTRTADSWGYIFG